MQVTKHGLAVAVCVVIGSLFAASALRGSPWGRVFRTEHMTHQLVHILVFTVLGALLVGLATSRLTRLLTVLTGMVVAFLVEYIEHLLGDFPVEISDVLTGAIGVLLGAVLTCILLDNRGRLLRRSSIIRTGLTAPGRLP